YYIYIILCTDGSFYTGYTKNVDERARLHANGRGARYTKIHKPKKVAYVEEFESPAEAMRREKAIKKLSHQQKEDLIKSKKTAKRSKRNTSNRESLKGPNC
ncbi:MAG TPA: GIY-YIG nuclease family protein, partial [Candidatus Bathyarchaeia archaeon]|nr:GIY-YIG nuclease family protein [Candidatus Bathyarchaeia archaeon]